MAVGGDAVEGGEAEVVDHDEVVAKESFEQSSDGVIGETVVERFDQLVGLEEAEPCSGGDRGAPERLRGSWDVWMSKPSSVLGAGNPAALRGERSLGASRGGDLLANKRCEQLVRRPALCFCGRQQLACELAHPAQPQTAEPRLELRIESEPHVRRR